MGHELNNSQKQAVTHNEGPMMVLAGPGSGKTMVITHRVINLIEELKVKPSNILVITFTKAAAITMQNRFENLSDSNNSKRVIFGTFHSVFFRILKSYYNLNVSQIIMENKKLDIFKEIVRQLKIEYEDENEFINQVTTEISLIKNELINVKYYNAVSCSNEDFYKIYSLYEAYKREKRAIDFDDMLIKCYNLLSRNSKILSSWQSRFRYILIDEFQDINRVQYETIKLLAKPNNNLFIVGDDDQSIYSFRGAKPEFLLNFPEEFGDTKKIILNNNYRSTKNIVKVSRSVIKNNNKRYIKNMITSNKDGNQLGIIETKDIGDEAKTVANSILELSRQKDIPLSDIAIIYRTNIQSRAVIDMFLDMNIPFIVRDKAAIIYDHWVAKDIISYMKLALDIKDKEALIRIINKPKRYISKAVLEISKKYSDNIWEGLYKNSEEKEWMINRLDELQYQLQVIKKNTPYDIIKYIRKKIGYDSYLENYATYRKIGIEGLIEVLNEIGESTKNFETIDEWFNHIEEYRQMMEDTNNNIYKDSVTLTTMHSSKGLEFSIVWIIGAVEGLIPHEKSNRDKDIEEERRLFYVGMTRAKEYLYISYINNRYDEPAVQSRFLNEIYDYFSTKIEVGSIVTHKKFGKGTVIDINKKSVSVAFEKKGKIKLNIKFCIQNNLIKCE
ncbi:ATP-dependent helicase [Vallitalea sp.]|jgi:DNA helicase-2/ATP-dependent DNA helicase PcrA|uniref:ATP-dependent helicase n=1 Tax=Vallitalea sp. TaxID=1882829 RepID=UPI0025E37A47|nr:ATP-dependent helicase [Vallitalea sp.]MCT4688540.1 ATP-dependent helicase [Vallitalea sp.]